MDKDYDVITFIWKYLYFKEAWVVNFADIIKFATIFIKTTYKDSKKVKRFRNYLLKCSLYLYFLIWQIWLISNEKMLMSAELKGLSRDLCVFWIFFR